MEKPKFEFKTPSNISVGRKIGMSHAGISRIRGGNRVPSNKVVVVIERVYGWPIIDQYTAIQNGTYAEEFERVIQEK